MMGQQFSPVGGGRARRGMALAAATRGPVDAATSARRPTALRAVCSMRSPAAHNHAPVSVRCVPSRQLPADHLKTDAERVHGREFLFLI